MNAFFDYSTGGAKLKRRNWRDPLRRCKFWKDPLRMFRFWKDPLQKCNHALWMFMPMLGRFATGFAQGAPRGFSIWVLMRIWCWNLKALVHEVPGAFPIGLTIPDRSVRTPQRSMIMQIQRLASSRAKCQGMPNHVKKILPTTPRTAWKYRHMP